MIKKINTIILLLFLAPSCKELGIFEQEEQWMAYFENNYVSDLGEKNEYVVLTYNVHMGFRDDQNPFEAGSVGGSPEHLDLLAEAINSVHPDFVILQDVARNVSNTLVEDQIGYLAKQLKMNFAYADYSEVNTLEGVYIRGTRGHALLTPYAIKEMDNIEILNQSRYESRSCLTANVEISQEKTISILGTHFRGGVKQEAKELETDKIIEIIKAQENPVILAGDFNNTINTNHIKRIHAILPSILVSANNNTITWGVIDNIFMDVEYFDVHKAGIMAEQYWNVSDHKFTFATFSYR